MQMKLQALQTLFTGQRLVELDETDSTNDYASTLLNESKPPEGTVILSYKQLSGKGQRGAGWESEPNKNLTFSIILYPRFLEPKDQFLLNQAMSLAIYDHAKSVLGDDVKIKWPNDIYCKDKKLAGILIENSVRSNQIVSSIVGTGLNVNQTTFVSDAPNPTSFKLITNKDHDLKKCLSELCSFLESRYLQLKAGKTDVLKKVYLNSLYRFNEFHHYKAGNKNFIAKITGITEEGKLILEKENGEDKSFDIKEIAFVI